MLLQEVTTARAGFTKESLERARAAVGELPDFSRLLPPAGGRQALLESLALSALTGPMDQLAAFGIAQAVPRPQRLDLRLVHPDAFVPFLDLLPSRDRDKTIHGVAGLRAQPAGRGSIEVWFDGRESEALLNVWSRGADMAPMLEDHEATVSASGRRPLWTHSVPPRPARRGRGRVRNRAAEAVPPTTSQRHNTSRYLASALLRRPGLWERLAGHQMVAVTSEEADHGFDWHVHRLVTPATAVHEDRLIAALEDTLAGPDLVMDRSTHECLPDACRMRFIPRIHDESWDGILTVTTTRAAPGSAPAARRARPFAVLGETQTVDGPTLNNRTLRRPRTPGRVIQMEVAPMAFDAYTPWMLARHLASVWALHGERVLIISSPPLTVATRHWGITWLRAERSAASTSAPWQRLRLVPGAGALYVHKGGHAWDDLEELVSRARDHFDWVLLADDMVNNHMCREFHDGVADEYLLVSGDPGFRTALTVSHPRHGFGSEQEIPLTPAEAAMAWRARTLRHVPVEKIPVSGLLLVADESNMEPRHEAFAAEADRALARLGTPVFGRLPSALIRSQRTVLDQGPAQADRAFCAEAMAVAAAVRAAGEGASAVGATTVVVPS